MGGIMKTINLFLCIGLIVLQTVSSYAVNDDDDTDSGPSSTLTGALLGGLAGGGIGTAIGSASGHAGKGALIGAGIGAAGGALLGAGQDDRKKSERYIEKEEPAADADKTSMPKNAKVKKRIVRVYDAGGNIVSEKEASR